jgi:plasmid maintenance system antidote protein VapI
VDLARTEVIGILASLNLDWDRWRSRSFGASTHRSHFAPRINEIVNGKRGVTPSAALRLAKFFNISSDFWLNLQIRWDLYHVNVSEAQTVAKIQVYQPVK